MQMDAGCRKGRGVQGLEFPPSPGQRLSSCDSSSVSGLLSVSSRTGTCPRLLPLRPPHPARSRRPFLPLWAQTGLPHRLCSLRAGVQAGKPNLLPRRAQLCKAHPVFCLWMKNQKPAVVISLRVLLHLLGQSFSLILRLLPAQDVSSGSSQHLFQ